MEPVKFSFVTSKFTTDKPPIKIDAAKAALKEMGQENEALVFGIPVTSGVDEQPFGTTTEKGAAIFGALAEQNVVGRVGDLEKIFEALPAYIANGALPDDEGLASRVQKTKKMIEDQIALYQGQGKLPDGVTVSDIIQPDRRHSVFSFENGMYTLEEASQRQQGNENAVSFSNLEKAQGLGSEFIDTCTCAVVFPGKDPVISYDAGLPVPPEMTKYVYMAMGYNEAIVANKVALGEGITATRKMMEKGALQAFCEQKGWQGEFNHQDPHAPVSFALELYGKGTHKTRAEFLAEGVLPAFQSALTNEISPECAVMTQGVLKFGGEKKDIQLS